MFKLDLSNSTLKNVLMLLAVVAVIFVVYQIYTNYTQTEGYEEPDNSDDVNDDNDDALETYENVVEHASPNPGSKGSRGTGSGPAPGKAPYSSGADHPDYPIHPEHHIESMTQQDQNPVERDMRNAQIMGMGGDQLSAQDLLPQDKSSTWASVNPEGQGTLEGKNFLQAGYHIGINTVGQTLRNANLQLRSEPPCPQVQVSPWLQSTIEPDVSRRPMEIGGCA